MRITYCVIADYDPDTNELVVIHQNQRFRVPFGAYTGGSIEVPDPSRYVAIVVHDERNIENGVAFITKKRTEEEVSNG